MTWLSIELAMDAVACQSVPGLMPLAMHDKTCRLSISEMHADYDGKAVGLGCNQWQGPFRLLDLTNREFRFGEWKDRVLIGAAVADDFQGDALGIQVDL
jgi:hypothetical protein